MTTPDQFYIIDLSNQLWRGYHARMTPLSYNGEPTKVVYLFTKMLRKLCVEKKPDYLCCADDVPRGQLVRRQLSAAYKADRKETPKDFVQQQHRARYLLHHLGVPVVRSEGWEADDVIATLARSCVSDEVHITIVSGDHDLHQLLDDPRIRLYDPHQEEYTSGKDLPNRYGYTAKELQKAKVYCGDKGDNVQPLYRGLGIKTALKMVRLNTPPLGMKEILLLNKALVGLRTDCDLLMSGKVPHAHAAFDPARLEHNGLDHVAALPVYRELGFKQWADKAAGLRDGQRARKSASPALPGPKRRK